MLTPMGHLMDVVRCANERAVFDLLDSYDGTKALVWQPELMKPFGLVAKASDLQRRQVPHMYKLEVGMSVPQCSVDHVLFVLRPELGAGQLLVEAVQRHLLQQRAANVRLHLVLVPGADAVFEQMMGDAADGRLLSAFKTTSDLPLRVLPLDSDLATLDMDSILQSLLVFGDWSVLHAVAQAVIQMQRLFGPAKMCHYKGDWAKWVHRLVQMDQRQQNDSGSQHKPPPSAENLQHLLIIDRTVDLVTPLLTQLTYEGLIDEFYGINYASTKLPASPSASTDSAASSSGTAPNEKKGISLDSRDELFAELRDLLFSAVATHLSRRIKALAQFEDSRHSATSVREMADFVRRLPAHAQAKAAAAQHTTVVEGLRARVQAPRFMHTLQCERDILHAVDTERTLAHIDNSTARAAPYLQVLRLMCLQSLIGDGLKAKVLDSYRTKFVQSYGYELVDDLINLQRAGILRERAAAPKSMPFSYPSLNDSGPARKGDSSPVCGVGQVKKQLRLLVEGVDEQKPTDCAYSYSGWAPVLGRLLEALLGGWSQPHLLDAVKSLPGAMEVNLPCESDAASKSVPDPGASERRPSVLMIVIGGITFGEMSALRMVARQRGFNLMVVTTSVINGERFLEQFHTLPPDGMM